MHSLRTAFAVALLLCLAAPFSSRLHAQDFPGLEKKVKEKQQTENTQSDLETHVVEVAVNDSLYIVGPNDLLNLAIFADRFYTYDVLVSSNGRMVVPLVGEVYVKDRTLAEVATLLRGIIDKTFKKAELTLSLVRARQIKVSVTGAVKTPGVITLPATARVSEALQLAGGIVKDTTALRGITITRGTQVLTADLMAFNRLGDAKANPFVMGGDVVNFPRIDRRISVFGAVNFEGHLDYVPGERLFDIIRIAGGFRSSVFLDSLEIVRFKTDNTTTELRYLDLRGYPGDQASNIEMKQSDLILVKALPKFQYHRLVLIKGEVQYPGSYPIERGITTLHQLITLAGGFTPDASLEEATVTRKIDENERDKEFDRLSKIQASDMREDEYEYFKARSRERVGQMVVDFKRLFLEKDMKEDLVLQDNDIIEVPIQKNYIRVIGRVNNPGNVLFHRTWNFLQYVDACKGFGWRANDGDVRVVKARTGELVDAENTGDYSLEPGDTIWVPEVPKTKFWEVALTTLGVLSQIAGILGIVIAVSRVTK